MTFRAINKVSVNYRRPVGAKAEQEVVKHESGKLEGSSVKGPCSKLM